MEEGELLHRRVREELHNVRTIAFIEMAKLWNNQKPSSMQWDKATAYAMIVLMERDQYDVASSSGVTTKVLFTMSSSGRGRLRMHGWMVGWMDG